MRSTSVTIITAVAVSLDPSRWEDEDSRTAAVALADPGLGAVLDAGVATFSRPSEALAHAKSLRGTVVGGTEGGIRVALHAGEPGRAGDDPVARALRLVSLAHGGQVVMSRATADLLRPRLPEGDQLVDLGAHRPRDLGRPEHVVELRGPGRGDRSETPRGLDLVPNNLPTQLTSFVGREDQITDLRRVLPGGQVVTLTGAGGCGKTRLALQVAAAVVDSYPGGVWAADLGPIADPGLVPSAVADVIGVGEAPYKALAQAVADHIGDKPMLVVLDNCEHLVDTCRPFVEGLVRQCPGLTVVPTSREPLGCAGEITWRVPSLSLPDGAASAGSESVRLFLDRARAARPSFRLDEANIDAVAEVCTRLDGIPLAIELAAALARALTPAQIAAQLADRFALLTGGGKGKLPRHRTLEASVDWSFSLLGDDERILLRRLGVFSGGFELGAAEMVAAGQGIGGWSVLEALTGLVDRSLVILEEVTGSGRYRLFETIRQYALAKLVEADEVTVVRDAHLEFYLDRSEKAEPLLEGRDMLATLAELDVEVDNFRGAFDWAISTGRAEDGLRLASALWLFWQRHRADEGASRLRLALEGGNGDPLRRANALQALADLTFYSGDIAGCLECGQQALALAEAAGDERAIGRATNVIGVTGVYTHDPDAVDHLRRALISHRAMNDSYYIVDSLFGLFMAGWYRGDFELGRSSAREALVVARDSGNPQKLSRALMSATCVAASSGELDEAIELAASWLAVCNELRDEVFGPASLAYLARLRAMRGGPEAALADVAEARQRSAASNSMFGLLAADWLGALIERDLGAPTARQSLQQAAAMAAALNTEVIAVECSALDVELAVIEGDLEAARASEAEVRRMVAAPYGQGARAWGAFAAAHLASGDGELERATGEAYQALEAWTEAPDRFGMVRALELLIDLDVRGGRHLEAARLLGATHAEREAQRWVVPPADAARRGALGEELERALGAEAAAAAIAEGAEMPLKEAVTYARRGRGARRKAVAGWASLTATELEVVRQAAEGLRNNDIAERLFMSPLTVKSHLAHAFSKLGVRNRAELVAYALPRLSGS